MSRCKFVLLAALLLPTLALADARVEARRHFKTGMALIADSKLDEGISELNEAYSVRPHPNVLFNIARAYEEGGRPADALVFYNRYLDANPPDADKVREIALKLEARLPTKKVVPPCWAGISSSVRTGSEGMPSITIDGSGAAGSAIAGAADSVASLSKDFASTRARIGPEGAEGGGESGSVLS